MENGQLSLLSQEPYVMDHVDKVEKGEGGKGIKRAKENTSLFFSFPFNPTIFTSPTLHPSLMILK